MSRISAPSDRAVSARFRALSVELYRPPSKNESGVVLMTAIILAIALAGRVPKVKTPESRTV
jgi:hypothetical protein